MLFKIIKGKHPLSIHVIWMIFPFALLAVYNISPSLYCAFHNFTGLPCLTCGSSRVAAAFLSGDYLSMFYYNPLVVLFCAGLCFFSLFELLKYIFNFELKVSVNRKIAFTARTIVITLIAANWLFLIVTGR